MTFRSLLAPLGTFALLLGGCPLLESASCLNPDDGGGST